MKNDYKVGMVIPMKGKLELIGALLKSINEKSSYKREFLTIYIADTGSSDKEKDTLKRIIRDEYAEALDIRLIEYDYYNFASINNDVVAKHINKDTDLLLLCNNDVELVNDAISILVDDYANRKNVGTLGARLMYPDGTVQHCGIHAGFFSRNSKLRAFFTHFLLKKAFKEDKSIKMVETMGNTGAFLLTSVALWNEIGGLNEGYTNCFEDVEYNIECSQRDRNNYTDVQAVCIHKESTTRTPGVTAQDYARLLSKVAVSPKFINKIAKIAETPIIKKWTSR